MIFRPKSNLTINKTIRLTKKSFFYSVLGFPQPHLGPLGDIEGFVQLFPGSIKAIELLIIQELIKFILNVIVLMDGLLMALENQFRTLLFLVHCQVKKYMKNQESNF